MSSAAKSNRNAAINIALAFAIMLLQSWFTDGIKGDALFPWWPGGALQPGDPAFWSCLLGMLALSIACAVLLYQRRRSFLPVEVQRIGQPGRVVPRAVLVLSISHPNWEWQPGELSRDRRDGSKERLALPLALDDALAVMTALGRGENFAWEQLLRAIQVHAPRLQRVVLIGSTGGTADSFGLCKKMIGHYFPALALAPAAVDGREARFEEIDDLLREYRQILLEEAQRKGEVMIDVTGGTKMVSIAAAMVTLEHPAIEFQYVETEGDKRVVCFNVVSGGTGNDSQ